MTKYVCQKCRSVIQEVEDGVESEVDSTEKCFSCGFDPNNPEEAEQPEPIEEPTEEEDY